MILPLALTLATHQSKVDTAFMVQAFYPAGSLQKDPTEPGGHSVSSNMPVPMTFKSRMQRSLAVDLTPTKSGIAVRLFNASQTDEWLPAADGNLFGWLEALDGKVWRPIEYHMWYTCGNSFHRVVLPAAYQWTFDRPIAKGSWKTQVRWVLSRGNSRLESPSIELNIPPTRTTLTPAMAAQNQVAMQGTPTLVPKSDGANLAR